MSQRDSRGTWKGNTVWCGLWACLAAQAFWKVGSGNGWHTFFFIAGFSVGFLLFATMQLYREHLERLMRTPSPATAKEGER